MDFYKDFPERSDAGTATTPDGGIVAGSDKLNDNDYAMIGANGTGSNSQGKGYKVKFSSIYNYLKGKLLGDSGMEATSERRGLLPADEASMLCQKRYPNQNGYISVCSFDEGAKGWVSFICTPVAYTNIISSPVVVSIFCNTNQQEPEVTAVSFGSCVEHYALGVWIGKVAGRYNVFVPSRPFLNSTKVTFLENALPSLSVNSALFDNIDNVSSLKKISISAIATQQSSLAASYIAERYSIDEEQALTRRMIANDPTVVEQFEAYNAYCEECKAKAKEELANQPQVLPADGLNNQTI